jgi:L-amino acid N-acyltransferase YncA
MMRRGGIALAAFLCALAALPALGQPAVDAPDASTPEAPGPAWFEYRLRQTVANGTGAYEGWSDALRASGRYELEGGSLWARYDWQYTSPDDADGVLAGSGSEDRRVSFDPASRRYVGRPIDLDEYDERDLPELAIWWRIPTNVAPGDTISILEETFRVEGPVTPSEVTHGRPAILLATSGTGTRDDAYGRFTTSYEDRYWFDAESGWFLAEQRTERDIGALDGAPATFDVTTGIELTAASYLPGTTASFGRDAAGVAVPAGSRGLSSAQLQTVSTLGFLLLLGAVIGTLLWLARRWERRSRRHDYEGRIAPLAPNQQADYAALSPFFGELMPHLVRQAQPWGPVAAWGSLGIEGIALPAPPGEAATIFAPQTACCEALRQHIDAAHFFSEVRHEHSFAARAKANASGVSLPGSHAYNVLETYELLDLSPLPADVSYDRQVVRRGSAAELPAVVQLADAVYGGSNARWLQTALEHGDVLLLALDRSVASETVVGFALVTVAGSTARFSGLTVAQAHRGRGLGKELNRARLRVAHDLGAVRAVVEVAAWNTASLEIARASGFRRAGSMYVETPAAVASNQKFRRR